MIISTAAQWAAVSLSASGVLIDVDGEVEEEWSSCSKCPLLGASVTQIGFTGGGGGGFLIPLPSWEAKGYDTIMFRGPATSLRLPLTHSELSLETILNKVSAV